MGTRDRVKQGIHIKTTHPPHTTPGGTTVERQSRVSVTDGQRKPVYLGVRIRDNQTITKFMLGNVDMTLNDPNHPKDTSASAVLNSLERYRADGETWSAWKIQPVHLPQNLSNFKTEFGVDHPDLDGQTVMWAVVYADEPAGFAGDHVYIGYADVTPP